MGVEKEDALDCLVDEPRDGLILSNLELDAQSTSHYLASLFRALVAARTRIRALELDRQRSEGAGEEAAPAGFVLQMPQPTEEQRAYVQGLVEWRKESEAQVTMIGGPPPASTVPAEERDAIAREVRSAWWAGLSGPPPWSDVPENQRATYRRVADYVLQREETLRREVRAWTDDARIRAENARYWEERCARAEDELAALKSSEREAAIAEIVEWHSGATDQSVTLMGDLCHSRRLVLHERARLKAPEGK